MLLDVVASATGSVAPSRDVIAGGLQAPCLQVEALATVLGLDLVGAIDAKIARNVARGYRHGGRAI
jgi:hypothetical protein